MKQPMRSEQAYRTRNCFWGSSKRCSNFVPAYEVQGVSLVPDDGEDQRDFSSIFYVAAKSSAAAVNLGPIMSVRLAVSSGMGMITFPRAAAVVDILLVVISGNLTKSL